ncbi:unnamed protein product, partial [Oppiella nova]
EIIKQLSTEGFRVDDLPEEMVDYCRLLRHTRYKSMRPMNTSSAYTEPIFGSILELSYAEWLNQWLTALYESFILNKEKDCEQSQLHENLSQVLGPSAPGGPPNSQRSEAFERALSSALSRNSIAPRLLSVTFLAQLRNQNVAQFLLPYVVIVSLKNATHEQRKYIVNERRNGPYVVIVSLKNATHEQRKYIVNEVKTIIAALTTDESIFSGETGHLSSQTVFHIYDYLKIWHKKRIHLHKNVLLTPPQQTPRHVTPRELRTAQLKDKEFRGVDYFLRNISTKELAILAFKCKAFSRALRYLEEYIRGDDTLFQKEMQFLQQIFLGLDDPDSVDGCNSRRVETPTIDERILIHEAMGQIQEAMLCCAKAVEHNPQDFSLQQKYLQTSMNNFDQSEQVYTYGCGLMHRRPEWRDRLAPYVIEAVWKLGDWRQLEQMVDKYPATCLTTFGSCVGDLFSSIITRKESDFEEKLQNLRRGRVGPLSAAAIEISGYVRGHQYVIELHILNDIQLIYHKLMAELDEEVSPIDSLKDRFQSVVEVWDQRNDLVRKTIKCQEPVLNAQRAMLSILAQRAHNTDLSLDIKKALFKSWLMSTKTSRKSGNIQRSYTFLLEMNKIRDSLCLTFGDGTHESTVSSLTDLENSQAILETAKIEWNKSQIGAIQYLKNQIEQNYQSSVNYCFQRAVTNLNESFSAEELLEIKNSMSYGSSSIPSYQSSATTTGSDVSIRDQTADEAFARLQLLYAKYCDQNGLLNQNNWRFSTKS